MTGERRDLSYPTKWMANSAGEPQEIDLTVAKKTLRYLSGTLDLWLVMVIDLDAGEPRYVDGDSDAGVGAEGGASEIVGLRGESSPHASSEIDETRTGGCAVGFTW